MTDWGTRTAARLGAALLLVGGSLAGALAAGTAVDGWIVAVVVVVLSLGLAPILIGSRRPPVVPPANAERSEALPSMLVLVAARDEAAVLPALVADLGAQDHRNGDGSPRFEVVVVDDRSSDGTAEAVRRAADLHGLTNVVTVVRRDPGSPIQTKGAALAAARPERSAVDAIVVLDADARVGPGFIRRAAEYVGAGVPALTARRRLHRTGRTFLAGAQADEQTQDGEIQRGRWASGGCSEFRGNGLVIRRDTLAAVGGFPAWSLTEDLDLSARLAATLGITVAWALDLEVMEQGAPTWRSLWRQRLRWSEGGLRRLLTIGPAVIASRRLPRRARLDFATYGLQLAAPPLMLGALIGAIGYGRPALAVGLIGSYLLAGAVLAFDALRWDLDSHGRVPAMPERVARALRAALFSLTWLAAINGALVRIATRRGPVRFDKTVRAAAVPPAVGEPSVIPGRAER